MMAMILVLYLPQTDYNQALEIAKRIRELINNTQIKIDQNKISTTIRVGISSTLESASDFSQLLITADMALCDSKRGGRKQVCSRE
jgi:diguanylate cyclase (GGDEF)-like protein